MIGKARRNAGQSVVVKVKLSQMWHVSQRAIFHRADLIVAQSKPARNISTWMSHATNDKEQKSLFSKLLKKVTTLSMQ